MKTVWKFDLVLTDRMEDIDRIYIGSIQKFFVWHIYEVKGE